jgi:predicted DNA binding CopG/RHH family protein
MSKQSRPTSVPKMTTDDEAETFIMQDLSALDFSQFKPMPFEFEKKEAQVNMRVPQSLLNSVKDKAKAHGVPYTRYIRMLMERDLASK